MTGVSSSDGADAGSGLVHQVRNLLAVIQTQTEVARLLGTTEAAQQALDLIERCGQETQQVLTDSVAEGKVGQKPHAGEG